MSSSPPDRQPALRQRLEGSALARLVRATLAADGRSPSAWLIDVGLLGAVTLLVLMGIDRGLSGRAQSGMAVVGLAVLLNHLLYPRVAGRLSAALIAAVSRETDRILDGLTRLDLERYEAIGRRAVVGRVVEDADRVADASPLLLQAATGAVTVALLMGYLTTISGTAAGLSLLLMAGIVGLTMLNARAMGARIALDRALGDDLRGAADDLIDGFAQVKQHRPRSDDLARRFDRAATALNRSRDAHFSQFYLRDTSSRQAFFALMAGVAFILPLFVPDVVDEVARLLVTVTFTLPPLSLTTMALTRLGETGALWQRIEGLVERVEAAAGPPNVPVEPPPFEGLTLSGVTFGYPDTAERAGFSIGPLDLTVQPGEIVFVTGANGSGKSTLIKLLCGLYRRQGGALRLGERVLPDDPGPIWRALFSAVFTDVVLFERLYGYEDADPAWINGLLRDLEIDHKVRFADGAFDTVDLSTGQRKRLGLVIALVHDRPVFVFDEWAADQDPRFRTLFYRRILPELKARGKAVVAVTHDDDAFDACDRRLHLADGVMEAR